jgi:hypothetical protein
VLETPARPDEESADAAVAVAAPEGRDATAISADAWLDVMESEYLGNFIPAGGGAVRFAVAEAATLDHISSDLDRRGIAHGLQVVRVDLASIRLHMLQNVVFAVAGALPWEQLLQSRLEILVAGAGYRWPEPGRAVSLAALAEANGVAPHLLRRDLTQALSREIWEDSRLTQDFRHAMIALLESRLSGDDAALAESVMEWLHGTLRSVGQVRGAQIGRRIGRQNARGVLMSLCRWVRSCGGTGIMLQLDIRRLHRERRAVADGLVYTPAAVMDCYEVLRQLIDDAEHFSGLFVAALADGAFLSDDPRRSLCQYIALKMRVWDDVRPQGRDNPLAPLVRIAP